MEISLEQYIELLNNLRNPSGQQAATIINQFKEQATTQFLIYSAQVILLDDVSEQLAETAIVMIKSVLRMVRYYGIDQIAAIWESIPNDQRNSLKQALVRGIMFPGERLRKMASSTLAIIAQLEYPVKWPDFFQVLATLCQNQTDYGASAIMGVLDTLADAFESQDFIRPRYIKERTEAQHVVTTLASQVLSSGVSPEMKISAVQMLLNSFKSTFTRVFTNNAELRENTINLLLMNFTIPNIPLHSIIYDFFTAIFKRAYQTMFPDPITAIVTAVTADLQSGNFELQRLGLIFLRKCSKEEFFISKKDNQKIIPRFTLTCAQSFTLPTMTLLVNTAPIEIDTIDEDLSDNIGFFAYKVLVAFSKLAGEIVFEAAREYYIQNRASPEWNVKCASILALKSVLGIGQDVEMYMRSIMGEMIAFAQDPNPTVSYNAILFIASFIKMPGAHLFESEQEEVNFILSLSLQLLGSDDLHAISACYIIANFANKYETTDVKSPLGAPEVFTPLLQTLWAQFNRPTIFATKLYLFICNALQTLISRSPYQTVEIRRTFCGEILGKFQNTLLAPPNDEIRALQTTLLDILGTVVYSLCGSSIDQMCEQIYSILYPLLPSADSIVYLISTIGNLIISSSPEYAARFANQLVPFLLQAQQSSMVQLISESSMIIGDLFRSASDIMINYALDFGDALLKNIVNDETPTNHICQHTMSLADLVKNSGHTTLPLRDRMMVVIRNFTHYRFNPEIKSQVQEMTEILEGIIYLAGAILYAFSNDADFITNKENINILFEFRTLLKPDVFKSPHIDTSLLLFLESALTNKIAARSYNIQLNHNNIKAYLKKIMNENKNLNISDKAKRIYSMLGSA